MLPSWILLFSLLTIHVDNYKSSQTSKVLKNVNSKSRYNNAQFPLQSPKQNHVQPASSEGNQTPNPRNGDTKLELSKEETHIHLPSTGPSQLGNGEGKSHQSAKKKGFHIKPFRSPEQTIRNFVSSEEMVTRTQGTHRLLYKMIKIICKIDTLCII